MPAKTTTFPAERVRAADPMFEIPDAPADAVGATDPYVTDGAGVRMREEMRWRREGRKRSEQDPAVLLNDLHEVVLSDEEAGLAPFLGGMTRQNKAETGRDPDGAVGRELRPGFVAYLVRQSKEPGDRDRARDVAFGVLAAMRAEGGQPAIWAVSAALRLVNGLSQAQIAAETSMAQQTVSEHLRKARRWIEAYARDQEWVQAYVREETIPRRLLIVPPNAPDEAAISDKDVSPMRKAS